MIYSVKTGAILRDNEASDEGEGLGQGAGSGCGFGFECIEGEGEGDGFGTGYGSALGNGNSASFLRVYAPQDRILNNAGGGDHKGDCDGAGRSWRI